MLLLRIISGISLLPSLIGFLCAYCISPGYPLDGHLDHYPAYESLAGFGSLPRLYSLCGLLGFPRYSAGFAGQWSFAPAILRVLWYLRAFSPWYYTGYDSNWAIRPFHGANLIFETSSDVFKR